MKKNKSGKKNYIVPWCEIIETEETGLFCTSVKPSIKEEEWEQEEEKDGDDFEIEL